MAHQTFRVEQALCLPNAGMDARGHSIAFPPVISDSH